MTTTMMAWTTTGWTRRSYQFDAAAVLTTQKEDKMSPAGWKTNLQDPLLDAMKFIRKLSTGRDTGFRESGSRAILNRTFSLDQSSPVNQSKVDQTSNQSFLEPGGVYGRLWCLQAVFTQSVLERVPQPILDDFFKFRFHYHPPTPCTISIPFSVLKSAYCHILQCRFGWLLDMKSFFKMHLDDDCTTNR